MKIKNKIIYQDYSITKFLIESPKYGNFEVIIDTEDWNKVKNYRWHVIKYNYISMQRNHKNTSLHRFILNLNNFKPFVDHINGNPLDNRKHNLRICTQAENRRNSKIRKDNTSGYKGVVWSKWAKKWMCRININKKSIHLGYFMNPRDAAFFYNIHAIKYHGEFAQLNKLQEDHVVYN